MTHSPNSSFPIDLSKRTPQEVFAHHIQAIADEDVDEIMLDYAETAYIISLSGVVHGKETNRRFFARILDSRTDSL